MNNQRVVASFQLVLLLVSTVSFSHGLYQQNLPVEFAMQSLPPRPFTPSLFEVITLSFISKFRSPLIPRVSAQSLPNPGCCALDSLGGVCSLSAQESCVGEFVPGVMCDAVPFCQKGCCADGQGNFASNTRQVDCSAPNVWHSDASCASVPGALIGCCFLPGKTEMISQRKCEIATERLVGLEASVEWDGSLNTLQCRLAVNGEVPGACIVGDVCTSSTASLCAASNGLFHEGFLCTSPQLNVSCEPTQQTVCSGERVHFVDSCGNAANVYDASRVNDFSYWDRVVASQDSCGSSDPNGNAGSKNCGNCNKARGGMCSNAVVDGFNPEFGDNYCAVSSCEFRGQTYRDGESWCVYDGAIGNGDDVVGSRHWSYVCSQGSVQIEPCEDGRQEICTQTNTPVPGSGYEFRSASCKPNNWRACFNLNKADDESELEENLDACKSTLHCRVQQVDIADKFSFEMCVPKYPAGFDFSSPEAQGTRQAVCAAATQNCTVVREQSLSGSCKIKANEGCLSEDFARKMNDLCRGLGDCGTEVNIAGVYTVNHRVSNAPGLSSDWIADLVALHVPIVGQYAEAEAAPQLFDLVGTFDDPGQGYDLSASISNTVGGVSMGLLTVGLFAPYLGTPAVAAVPGTAAAPATGLVAYGGPLIGAAVGAYVGLELAQELELSPLGAIFMATGAAALGVATGAWLTGLTAVLFIPVFGWILAAVALIVLSLFFSGSDCGPIDVEFTCKPWDPPSGGDACASCNGDPLKPCSKYRCESLGAACSFVNDFEHNGLCIEVDPNDVTPPTITPDIDRTPAGLSYTDSSSNGFTVEKSGGSCIDPLPTIINIKTSEASKCRVSSNISASFDTMDNVGSGVYDFDHSFEVVIPDPSHGRSNGINWTGDFDLLVRCQDPHGNENAFPYIVDMCVRQGDDNLPTTIDAASPRNGAMVSMSTSLLDVDFFTYELASCKWDASDVSYDEMANSMTCSDTLFQPSSPLGYRCSTQVSLSSNVSQNDFFVRCKDQPWLVGTPDESKRNENVESYTYTLNRPLEKISIVSVSPDSDFFVESPVALFDLEVETSGGGDFHVCEFSRTGFDQTNPLLVTGASNIHSQPGVNLGVGNHNLYVKCFDETGDVDQRLVSFEILRDTKNPGIARISQSGSRIDFETTESAECRYSSVSCNFDWVGAASTGIGLSHSIVSQKGTAYHIRCEDAFGNKPSGCSVSVQAV